jgi:hypothetical protein
MNQILMFGFLMLSSTVGFAVGDQTLDQRLTGGSSRVWVYQRVERVMGDPQSGSCIKGEEYKFLAAHTVVITHCVNKQLVSETKEWSARSDGVDDWIRIGSEEFQLMFNNNDQLMRLRKKAGVKGEETIDKDFRKAS